MAKQPVDEQTLLARQVAKDNKELEAYVKTYFSRPFSRSLRYIYTGVLPSVETFVLGTTLDEDLNYRDGNQVIGFVALKNTEKSQTFLSWLSNFKLPLQMPGVFYLENLILLCNKVKWDQTKIEITVEPLGVIYGSILVKDKKEAGIPLQDLSEAEEKKPFWKSEEEDDEEVVPKHVETIVATQDDGMIKLTKLLYVPTEYYASRLQIAELARWYHPITVFGEGRYRDIAFETDQPNHALEITEEHLSFTGHVFNATRIVLFRGYDLLHVSSLKLPAESYTTGLRIWPEGHRCFNYGSYLKTEEATVVAIRTNTAIFPTLKESIS